MLCGELSIVTVTLENCGSLPVTRLLMASTSPECVSLGQRRGELCEVSLPSPLVPGASMQTLMRLRAPHLRGSYTMHLLFYCESSHDTGKTL